MKAALLIILLASICLLHTGADIPVHPDFDAQKLAGTWYSTQFVLKNHEPFDVTSIDEAVEPSEEGDLAINIRYIYEGTCHTDTLRVVHTDTPGIFELPGTPEHVTMVDVDYESYHIMHISNEDTYSLYLLSRTREPSDDVKTKFRERAEALGFDVNRITNTKLAGEAFCSISRGTRFYGSGDYYGVLFAESNPTSCFGDQISFSFRRGMPIMLLSIGKSEFGRMFEEWTTSIISIMVLQMTLIAICHIFWLNLLHLQPDLCQINNKTQRAFLW